MHMHNAAGCCLSSVHVEVGRSDSPAVDGGDLHNKLAFSVSFGFSMGYAICENGNSPPCMFSVEPQGELQDHFLGLVLLQQVLSQVLVEKFLVVLHRIQNRGSIHAHQQSSK